MAGAVNLLVQSHPINSALSLIVVMTSLAAEYLLLGAEFVAAVQVIVYAGAIMVLFLFVLMLLNVKREEDVPGRGGRAMRGFAMALVALLVFEAGAVLLRAGKGAAPQFDASTRTMAGILFSAHFLYVFEATSILILAALVGAVVLAKKEL